MVYLIQVIGGNPLIGYANYFFETAGLDSSDAFNSSFSFAPCLDVFTNEVLQWALAILHWVSSEHACPGR